MACLPLNVANGDVYPSLRRHLGYRLKRQWRLTSPAADVGPTDIFLKMGLVGIKSPRYPPHCQGRNDFWRLLQ